METTLSVSELLDKVGNAVTSALPGPVWVRGEISGFKRTSGGAAFFRLVDPESSRQAIDVAARGRVIGDIDFELTNAGVGALRSGIEIRAMGTVSLDRERSQVRLSLLKVDPAFIAGRLAFDRAEVIRRLAADGSLTRNAGLDRPLVPLRVGLVTSRGSAAHADFLKHLQRPGYRFRVSTVHATVQGERAPEALTGALGRLSNESIDVAVLIRGGGSKLDLSAFDTEQVARAVANMPVPVVTGIGHETDRSVADEVAAVAEKTPTAAAEWLVSRVSDFSGRIDRAQQVIGEAAREAGARSSRQLAEAAARIGATRATLVREQDRLESIRSGLVDTARKLVRRERERLDGWGEVFAALGVEETLKRGFALVTREDGSVVGRGLSLRKGERVRVRFADGSVDMSVEGPG